MEANFYLINKIALFLINLTGVWLIFWVYFSNPKKKNNQLFSLLTFSILAWVNAGYLLTFSESPTLALFWARFAPAAVFVFLIILYFFSVHFPREGKRYPFLDKITLALGISLSFLTLFTNLIIKKVEFTKWGVNPIFTSSGKYIFYGIVIFLTSLAVFQIFRKSLKLSIKEKLKAQYFLIGFFIFILLNIIFNVALPLWRGTIQYWQFGNYSAIFLLGFTAYAIVKRELFGMKVVLTTLFVTLIAILLALDTFVFTAQLNLQILKGAILIIFLYFGYLMIKSVLAEIERREEVEKLSRAKSEFISIASHQLRTPLTAIKGYISMILEGTYGKMTAKIRRPMENVYKSNERLIKLVNDLLSVSRIESGRIELELEKTSLEDLIFSVVQELKITAKKKGLRLKWQKPAEPLPETLIDKDQIRQVILNVIDNAIRYTHYGQIVVKLKRQKEFLLIEISDTGGGLSKEEISYLFESFSRGRVGARLWSDGMGLGLYVAKKFVEMHQGKIWTESPGKEKGSTFYIELPIK